MNPNPRIKSPSGRLRIVVAGYIVRGPLGGLVWHHLQYVMGLARLGHDVYFIEDSDDYPACYDTERNLTDCDPTYGLKFATRVFDRMGLGERWAYHDAHTSRWVGPCGERAVEICKDAELLLNLSGMNPQRPWLAQIPVRVLVDTDPVFTQIRNLVESWSRNRAVWHTDFFTFAENIGREDSNVPLDGFPWQPTRQPVVLDVWPVTPGRANGKFTTVMQWKSYAGAEYNGRRYGMKSESFGPYEDLPTRVGPIIELAQTGAPEARLRQLGWQLRDALELTRDPWEYQDYIQKSRAEFGVAKHGYVASRSGWFSERSAGYLASGRPVLAQNTGFDTWLPTGEGVVAFQTPEGAAAGIDDINHRYDSHCTAARELVGEYFEASKVLNSLIERSLAS